jgi:hypothetical protein
VDYKQLITDCVLANKSRKQTALELKIPPGLLDKVISKVWPNTRGKWTTLRETLGLSPWGHMGDHNAIAPEFRFIKSPQCNSCRREEWRGHPIPLNEIGLCLNCAAVQGNICAQIDTSLL